jgi:hypothetical protein
MQIERHCYILSLGNLMGGCETDWVKSGTSMSSCKHGTDFLGLIKCWEFHRLIELLASQEETVPQS